MESGSLSCDAPMNGSGNHHLDMEHLTFNIAQGNHQQSEQLAPEMPNFRKRKRANSTKSTGAVPVTRVRDWTDDETSALLKFVNLPQFRPQRRTRSKKMDWERIVEAIHRELGANPAITVKRCKERMKTLTGDRYYRSVTSNWERMLKEKNDGTDDDLRKLIESCGLTVDWYEAIKEYKAIQGPCKLQGRSRMQMHCDVDRNVTDRPSSSSTPMANVPFELVQTTSPQSAGESVNKQIAARFNSLNDSRRSTLLDLRFCCCIFEAWSRGCCGDDVFDLDSDVCEWLSILQNRRDSAIYEDVIALVKMGLVSWHCHDGMGKGSDDDISKLSIQLSSLKVHEKFFKKVMERNPTYDTRQSIEHEAMVTFDATCWPPGITMLNVWACNELEEIDLSAFRKLRWLCISSCPKLREMIGWECLEELRWLDIASCPSYDGRPPLQKIPSLQSFRISRWPPSTRSRVDLGGELDVSGCVRLRKLEIRHDDALSSIRGLEGLRSLIELDLEGCDALQSLPDICHMKDLTRLSILGTGVEEIKGVEKLLSLEHLYCSSSKLKTLPDLSHLPHLRVVELQGCPLTKDPSSPYFGTGVKYFEREIKHVDVSDTNDSEREVSDEDL